MFDYGFMDLVIQQMRMAVMRMREFDNGDLSFIHYYRNTINNKFLDYFAGVSW
jgi:hypothetical protein